MLIKRVWICTRSRGTSCLCVCVCCVHAGRHAEGQRKMGGAALSAVQWFWFDWPIDLYLSQPAPQSHHALAATSVLTNRAWPDRERGGRRDWGKKEKTGWTSVRILGKMFHRGNFATRADNWRSKIAVWDKAFYWTAAVLDVFVRDLEKGVGRWKG